MDTASLQFLSRFALPPNALHYCGRDSAHRAFLDCLTQADCSLVPQETKHFIVLWPYLKTIAQATGRDPFSREVIEAYWFGNDLLNQIQPSDYQLLLSNLQAQGVPGFLIDEIKTKRPDPFIPIHLFNILHVGVGRASGSVPFNLESINHCMIRWGQVESLTQNSATLSLTSLKTTSSGYRLTPISETAAYSPILTPDLKVSDTVVVHWHQVVHTLKKPEPSRLSYWTIKFLETL